MLITFLCFSASFETLTIATACTLMGFSLWFGFSLFGVFLLHGFRIKLISVESSGRMAFGLSFVYALALYWLFINAELFILHQ